MQITLYDGRLGGFSFPKLWPHDPDSTFWTGSVLHLLLMVFIHSPYPVQCCLANGFIHLVHQEKSGIDIVVEGPRVEILRKNNNSNENGKHQ